METIRIDRRNNYAIMHLDRGKANAINHEMVKEIRNSVAALSQDKSVRGVIITGKPHFFSAGLDLIELAQYGYEEIKSFWTDFFGMMLDLAKFPKPTIAAISGHSPAGGAIIAITCDHRYMAEGDKYTIGLNEVAVGILISEPIFHLYSFWLGKKNAYQALLAGKLFTGPEAKEAGLVDEIYVLDELLAKAEEKMQQLLRANFFILSETKKVMRKDLWAKLSVDLTGELEDRAKYWMSPQSQESIKQIVEKLTAKRK